MFADLGGTACSESLSTDTSCQLNVFGHNCDSLGVDCAQICVFEESYHVRFSCFLYCKDGLRLEPQVCLHLLCDFSDEALEWQLPDEQLS